MSTKSVNDALRSLKKGTYNVSGMWKKGGGKACGRNNYNNNNQSLATLTKKVNTIISSLYRNNAINKGKGKGKGGGKGKGVAKGGGKGGIVKGGKGGGGKGKAAQNKGKKKTSPPALAMLP